MMYPLKFKPYLCEKVWGGEKIAPFKGIFTTRNRIGESWEISAVKDHLSVVTDGADQGKTILELLDEQKEKLVGQKVYAKFGDTFPLLI